METKRQGTVGSVLDQFTHEQIEYVRKVSAPEATDAERYLLFHKAHALGLDPLSNHLYLFKKGKYADNSPKHILVTGIDGMRLGATRNPTFGGTSDVLYDEGLTHFQMVADERKRPRSATVVVYRVVGGVVVETQATALMSEYDGKKYLWNTAPYQMLGKCAEALALRKACPAELSGLYAAEEMDAAEGTPADSQNVFGQRVELNGDAAEAGPELVEAGAFHDALAQELETAVAEAKGHIPNARKLVGLWGKQQDLENMRAWPKWREAVKLLAKDADVRTGAAALHKAHLQE